MTAIRAFQSTLIALALLVVAGIAGCGQKGDLYLPDETQSGYGTAP